MSWSLAVAALSIFVLGCFILSRFMSMFSSMLVSILKVLIPLIYFSRYYDGRWTFLDDISYMNQGRELLSCGYNPFTFFFDSSALSKLFSLSRGNHILYGWWNFMSQYVFGPYYYSPVFLNVGLTFISAYFLYRISVIIGFGSKYSKLLAVFFLFQWDLLAWSSFINLKDILVLTMTVIAFYYIIRIIKLGINYSSISVLGLLSFLFLWIRFYAPILIFGSFIVVPLLRRVGSKMLKISVALAIIVLYLSYSGVLGPGLQYYYSKYVTGSLLFGPIRFLLTPKPWSINSAYSFLFVPSILNWIFFVPSVIGGYILIRNNNSFMPLFVYFVVTSIFYGLVTVVQGPRHRICVDFVYAWMQFHFIWAVMEDISGGNLYARRRYYYNVRSRKVSN